MTTQQQATSRRLSREIAFQFLFSRIELSKPPALEDFNHFCASFGVEAVDYAWEVVTEYWKNAKSWMPSSYPLQELAPGPPGGPPCGWLPIIIFRTDIPKTVAINEAIGPASVSAPKGLAPSSTASWTGWRKKRDRGNRSRSGSGAPA